MSMPCPTETPMTCPVCGSTATQTSRAYRAGLPRSESVFGPLSMLVCRECGVGFAAPCPTPQALDAYYAVDYRGEGAAHRQERDPGPWSGQQLRARSQFEFVQREAGSAAPLARWLDIGAGYGYLLDEARVRGIAVTAAIEPDHHSQARLREHQHQTFDSLADVEGKWDVISFSHVLEHVAQPQEFLGQVGGLLSAGGVVFCEVPNEVALDSATNDAPHLLFFTAPSLTRLFAACGFALLRVATCGEAVGGLGAAALPLLRRLGQRAGFAPPRWADHALHAHFNYSKKDNGKWIRLLARRA